jgi:dienelactone hydrolase
MRFLCSCSAAVVLVLTGCGAGHAPDPFAYDHSRALAVRDQGVALSGPKVAVHVVSYAAAGRVKAFLIVPRAGGKRPAVLFLHGSGGNREDLLLPAVELASRGFVTMTISQPNDAATFKPLVVNARRALDVLVARKDVDPKRLGLVGFSLGAQTAAILAGDEARLKAIAIVAGRGGTTPLYWIRKSHAHLFFAAGTKDEVVPHAQLVALIQAAPDHPLVRWYATGHGMNRRAFDDLIAWQAREIGFRPHGGH